MRRLLTPRNLFGLGVALLVVHFVLFFAFPDSIVGVPIWSNVDSEGAGTEVYLDFGLVGVVGVVVSAIWAASAAFARRRSAEV